MKMFTKNEVEKLLILVFIALLLSPIVFALCSKSDGATILYPKIYEQGYVTYGPTYSTTTLLDDCVNGYLRERYCQGGFLGNPAYTDINCNSYTYGATPVCYGGKCIASWDSDRCTRGSGTECTDFGVSNDPGFTSEKWCGCCNKCKSENKGYCATNVCDCAANGCGSSESSTCTDSDLNPTGQSITLKASGYCTSGPCSNAPDIVISATDVQNGNNPYTKGAVTAANTIPYTDECTASSMWGDMWSLSEYYCANGALASTNYYCPNGCNDGACIQSSGTSCPYDVTTCPLWSTCTDGSKFCTREGCTSLTKDCTSGGAVCGNGACESGESTSCPGDCGGGGGGVCGNSRCETGESTSCPQDCVVVCTSTCTLAELGTTKCTPSIPRSYQKCDQVSTNCYKWNYRVCPTGQECTGVECKIPDVTPKTCHDYTTLALCTPQASCYWAGDESSGECKTCGASSTTCIDLGNSVDCTNSKCQATGIQCNWDEISESCFIPQTTCSTGNADTDNICDDPNNLCTDGNNQHCGDNCPAVANNDQADCDGDSIGDVCDADCSDITCEDVTCCTDLVNNVNGIVGPDGICDISLNFEDTTCEEAGGDKCTGPQECIGGPFAVTSDSATGKCCMLGQCGLINYNLEGGGVTYTVNSGECINANEYGVGKRTVVKYDPNNPSDYQEYTDDCTILPKQEELPFFSLISFAIMAFILITFYAFQRKNK